MPTVMYTDVNGQRNKLVTDDRHQLTTVTVHLSCQHLRRSAIPEIVGAHRHLRGSHDLTRPFQGWFAIHG